MAGTQVTAGQEGVARYSMGREQIGIWNKN